MPKKISGGSAAPGRCRELCKHPEGAAGPACGVVSGHVRKYDNKMFTREEPRECSPRVSAGNHRTRGGPEGGSGGKDCVARVPCIRDVSGHERNHGHNTSQPVCLITWPEATAKHGRMACLRVRSRMREIRTCGSWNACNVSAMAPSAPPGAGAARSRRRPLPRRDASGCQELSMRRALARHCFLQKAMLQCRMVRYPSSRRRQS